MKTLKVIQEKVQQLKERKTKTAYCNILGEEQQVIQDFISTVASLQWYNSKVSNTTLYGKDYSCDILDIIDLAKEINTL